MSDSQVEIDFLEGYVAEYVDHLRQPFADLQVFRYVLFGYLQVEDGFYRSLEIFEEIVVAKFRHGAIHHRQQTGEIQMPGKIVEDIGDRLRVDVAERIRDLRQVLLLR